MVQPAVAVAGGAPDHYAPKSKSPGDQHIFWPHKAKAGRQDPLGPLTEVNPRPTGGGYFEPPPLSFSCDIF